MATRSILARNNTTVHFEVTIEGRFVFAEKCRDSIGGFANLMSRLEAVFGARLRSTDLGLTWTVSAGKLAGKAVTISEVNKL